MDYKSMYDCAYKEQELVSTKLDEALRDKARLKAQKVELESLIGRYRAQFGDLTSEVVSSRLSNVVSSTEPKHPLAIIYKQIEDSNSKDDRYVSLCVLYAST